MERTYSFELVLGKEQEEQECNTKQIEIIAKEKEMKFGNKKIMINSKKKDKKPNKYCIKINKKTIIFSGNVYIIFEDKNEKQTENILIDNILFMEMNQNIKNIIFIYAILFFDKEKGIAFNDVIEGKFHFKSKEGGGHDIPYHVKNICPLIPLESVMGILKDEKWKSDDFIKSFLKCDDTLISSLTSFLWAENEESTMGRFMYLWISINGIYQYFSKFVKEKYMKWRDDKAPEYRKIAGLSDSKEKPIDAYKDKDYNSETGQVYCLSKMLNKRITIENEFEKSRDITEETIFSIFFENNGSGLFEALRQLPNSDTIVRIPYIYRCNLFHADKPNPIFNIYFFINQNNFYSIDDINYIEILNKKMEEYIFSNIYEWIVGEFDQSDNIELIALEFIQNAINKKIKAIEKKKNADKDENEKEKAQKQIDALKQLRSGGHGGQEAQPAAAQSNATNN